MFIRQDVLKLSLPIVAEQTFIVLMGMVNIMMAGHIGEEAVSAIGIAIARVIGAVLIMYPLLKGSKTIRLSKVYPVKFNIQMQKSIFGIGIPASVEALLFHGGKLITQVFIVGMGTGAIAANYIAGSVISMLNVPGSALSIAATTIVGQNMGRGESEKAKNDLMYVVKLSSVCLLICCAVAFPFAEGIARMYTQSENVKILSANLIRAASVCIPMLWPFAFIINAGLKGAGDAKYTMVTSVIGMWAFRITLGYVLGIPLKLGVMGIWMGMFVDWFARGALYYFRLKNGKWNNNRVVAH